MNEIPIEEAQERATARLIRVLRAKFQDEVAALNAAQSRPLPLVELMPDAVWRLGTDIDIATTVRLHGLGIFVMPDGAAELMDPRTGSAQVYGRLDRSTWRVLLLFQRVGAYAEHHVGGEPLRASEMMYSCALLYKAALILTLAKYVTDSDNVHEIKVLNSYADYVPNDNAELTGRASLTLEVTQNVLLPQPSWGAVT